MKFRRKTKANIYKNILSSSLNFYFEKIFLFNNCVIRCLKFIIEKKVHLLTFTNPSFTFIYKINELHELR